MKRPLHERKARVRPNAVLWAWAAIGAAGNAFAGVLAVITAPSADRRLPAAVRATGNGTFVAFAAPIVLRAGKADRWPWFAYAGAHAAHVVFLAGTARRHRQTGGSFSPTSRYGGALGYTAIAVLAAKSYTPGGIPHPDRTLRRLHRAGEQFLFGLYAFTIIHGYMAKGRNRAHYGPLAAVWLVAAARGQARWHQRPLFHETGR